MYAIVEIAGQQFKVEKDQKVFVHRLKEDEGKKVAFDNVLLLGDGDKFTVGAPAIDGAQVGAKVLRHLKGDKVIVFKKKRRKGYKVKNGHRQALTEILSADPAIEVMATAADPLIAASKIDHERPDVITLDVEMPRMDGLSFLKQIMATEPIPVVMCSSLTEKGAEVTMQALQYGAVEIINKPRMGARQFLEDSHVRICDAVKAAAKARVRRLSTLINEPAPKLTADVMLSQPRSTENF
jgi:ribosomal protein L21